MPHQTQLLILKAFHKHRFDYSYDIFFCSKRLEDREERRDKDVNPLPLKGS
jgi:hypothetical protein